MNITYTPKRDYGYLIYHPDGMDYNRKYPAMLFYHGLGERGDGDAKGLDLLNKKGVPEPLKAYCREKGIILFAGQCPTSEQWSMKTVQFFFDELRSLPYIDPTKIAVSGLSLGGGAVKRLVSAAGNAGKFIAAVDVCGVASGSAVWENVAKVDLPYWLFHARNDGTVPAGNSTYVYNKLKELGCTDVHLTMWETGGHAIWNKAFAEPDLQAWLTEKYTGELVADFDYWFQNRIYVKLDAAKSKGAVKYSWRIVERPEERRDDFNDEFRPGSADAVLQGITYLSRGEYVIELTVQDANGNTATTRRTITVK